MKQKQIIFSVLMLFFVFTITPQRVFSAVASTPTYDTSLKPLVDFLNIFLNFSYQAPANQLQINISPTTTLTPAVSTTPAISPTGNPSGLGPTLQPGNYTYYPQCDGAFDNYPLQFGCNICKAGCGIATVAMMLSSFVDPKFTPPAVADIYKQIYLQTTDPVQKKYFATGCDGSSIVGAQTILKKYGLQTTDIMIYSSNSDAASDFKLYLNNGWTMFALARYSDDDSDHFFWVTQMDANNNIWAYDSFYGRYQSPPFDENLYYPFPKYRMAFGVKKI